jgi:hypothetical protein
VSQSFVPQQSDYVRVWEEGWPEEAAQRSSSWGKFKSLLKGIPKLHLTVRSAKRLLRFPRLHAVAEYRQLRIERNAQGFLTPMKDLRVIR